MAEKKKDDGQYDAFQQAMWLEQAVDMLCHQITKCHHDTPDPEMAITVDVATTDKKAKELGWPSARLMLAAVTQAIKNLPEDIVNRIELDEV
jgi:hypothetical protein